MIAFLNSSISNFEKRKYENRQLVYFLYRLKKAYKATLQKFDWHY